LVWWRGGSIADDSWERGWKFSPVIHPYLEYLHDVFGGNNIILPSDKIIRILC
jgi:hypothetical protein